MGLRESLLKFVGRLGGNYSSEEEDKKTTLRSDYSKIPDDSAEILEKVNRNLTTEEWLKRDARRQAALRSLRGLNIEPIKNKDDKKGN